MEWPFFKRERQLEEALKVCREELEVQAWGLKKTNETIKLLYKELAEKNKRLQELDQLKSDFVATVSHELRTPLTIIREFILIIADEIPGKLTNEQREYVNIVKGNIERLSRLINNLLDISKIEAGKIELKRSYINIADLAKGVISELKPKAEEKDVILDVLFQPPIAALYADRDRIIQVVTNLVENAIKFTPQKGSIAIEIKDKGKEIECSVTDTGPGIAREDLDKLFVRFQQLDPAPGLKTKGTGLGLAISKELIEIHNGRIWAESDTGKGTKFIFTLPKQNSEIPNLEREKNG